DGDPAVPAAGSDTGGSAAPVKTLNAAFADSRLPGMKGVAESELLRLLADEQSGAVAVVDKRNGRIWHSNPPERDTDTAAAGVNKDLLSAQLRIEYYNSFGQLNAVNSYTDSAKF